ncbi:MAG: hypothetical protein CMJ06_03115 [Pelagibacterales bacterium]|nr:hypothetical protein [Pelagibacterales bacterium]OUU62681.1 MAG: hypothetical protein CBC22_03360 [Alphaproteobacteria bacterium TMED62]|tara:strand:- start:10523 stop:11062 length:540 start_codon:yes stop_codon:yes gene_type:complete
MSLYKKKLFKTPSQTVGPFFQNYLKFDFNKNISSIKKNKIKNRISLNLNIKDKKNRIVKDAFIEYWLFYKKNNKKIFLLFNRIKYDIKKKAFLINLNEYKFNTYLYLTIFSRGLLNHLHTVIYFNDLNFFKKDIFFKKLPIDRRHFMIAKLIKFENDIKFYKHDLHLNGTKESIFFYID